MFNSSKIKTFRFTEAFFSEEDCSAILRYALDNSYTFEERFIFHGAKQALTKKERNLVQLAVNQLHLAAGVSYYKSAAPPRINIENQAITRQTASFFENLYLHGLGEFSFRNNLDLRNRISFPATVEKTPPPTGLMPQGTVVPVGGGKDSIVTIEALKQAGLPFSLISIGGNSIIDEIAKIAETPLIKISRSLSPRLFELNQEGALNGHVPISAILGFAFTVASVLYGFNTVVMSNERSANSGNLVYQELDINHQFSKSLAFEKSLESHIRSLLSPNFNYFSFLRPLSELSICRLFSRQTDYHSTFSSCNSAYKISKQGCQRWCLDCPKCLFVFIALAPFLSKERLLSIFEVDLLNQEDQIPLLDQLTGFRGHRPFECVGETQETKAALILLSRNEDYQNDILVKHFKEEHLSDIKDPDDLVSSTLLASNNHRLPSDYEELLSAYSRTTQ